MTATTARPAHAPHPRSAKRRVNLLLIGDYYDIALRDFGLLLAALTLARLATAFPATQRS